MYLGIVLCGEGAASVMHAGALQALHERGVRPYAICGAGGGAVAAALLAQGKGPAEIKEAACLASAKGRRLMDYAYGARREQGLLMGRRLTRLLMEITCGAALRECAMPLMLPCEAALSGKTLVFSSRPAMQTPGLVFTREAPLWFAVRAAMGTPGLLAGLSWMETPLLGVRDPQSCVRALRAAGAQKLLFIVPACEASGRCDAFEQSALRHARRFGGAMDGDVGVMALRAQAVQGVPKPWEVQSLISAGYEQACAALDGLMGALTGETTRVLPFRRPR